MIAFYSPKHLFLGFIASHILKSNVLLTRLECVIKQRETIYETRQARNARGLLTSTGHSDALGVPTWYALNPAIKNVVIVLCSYKLFNYVINVVYLEIGCSLICRSWNVGTYQGPFK